MIEYRAAAVWCFVFSSSPLQQSKLPFTLRRYLTLFYAKIETDLESAAKTTKPPPHKKYRPAESIKEEPTAAAKGDNGVEVIVISDSDDE